MARSAFRLGASDEMAGRAERLQFTIGEGPCLIAADHGRTIAVGVNEIEQRWPEYAAELVELTPYRGVLSLPLRLSRHSRGALDLFLRDERQLAAVRLLDATMVTEGIIDALAMASTIVDESSMSVDEVPAPRWLQAPTAVRREAVWIAMGMIMSSQDVAAVDALAVLRAHSFSSSTDLDEVADQVLRGDLPVS